MFAISLIVIFFLIFIGVMLILGGSILRKRKKTLLIISVLILIFIMVLLPRILPFRDIAILPEKMDISVEKTDDGYTITIQSIGDYENMSLDSQKRWVIWDATNIGEIASGFISNNDPVYSFNDTNGNRIVDVGDKIYICDSTHSFEGYYFIVPEEDMDSMKIIHTKLV